jgi:hypothetical protein
LGWIGAPFPALILPAGRWPHKDSRARGLGPSAARGPASVIPVDLGGVGEQAPEPAAAPHPALPPAALPRPRR